MSEHPDADALIELARRGPQGGARGPTHAHCLVCDECRALLETVLTLRSLTERPVARVPLPVDAVRLQ